MGATRDQGKIPSFVPAIRGRYLLNAFVFATALCAVSPALASSVSEPALPNGGWVLLGVLAILAAGLWLQSTRQRQS